MMEHNPFPEKKNESRETSPGTLARTRQNQEIMIEQSLFLGRIENPIQLQSCLGKKGIAVQFLAKPCQTHVVFLIPLVSLAYPQSIGEPNHHCYLDSCPSWWGVVEVLPKLCVCVRRQNGEYRNTSEWLV